MKKNLVIFSLFPLLFFANSGHAYSETTTLSHDGGMEIQIIYPDSVLIDRTFSISFLIQNNGWESKQDIILKLTNPDDAFVAVTQENIQIDELTSSSSFGTTLDYIVHEDATSMMLTFSIVACRLAVELEVGLQDIFICDFSSRIGWIGLEFG